MIFSVGILVTIALIGGLTAALGRMLGDVGTFVNYTLALIFLFLGLHFLGVVQIPWTGGGPTGSPRKGVLGAFFVGLLFGLGVGHCSVIVLAGTSAQRVQRYLNWNEGSRGHSLLRQACGVLVIAGGAYLIYTA